MRYFFTNEELAEEEGHGRRPEEFDQYSGPPLTDEMVAAVEAKLGVKLPLSLLELLRERNGGFLKKFCFDVPGEGEYEDMRILGGIGWADGLDGEVGSLFMAEEYEYPAGLLWLAGDAHTNVVLDYRSCGPQGEPAVAWYDAEFGTPPIHLANTFAEFLGMLRECSELDEDD